MSTFDYITAWHETAKPAYECLPQNLRDLLAQTAETAGDLRQLSDCSMPWPDDPSFRHAFEKIPAEVLAIAARAIYCVGHWYPSESANGYEIPGRDQGATWKFSHYADQELRSRLGLPKGDSNKRGFDVALIEGAIRVTYNSRDSWQWVEVAPATQQGLEYARSLIAEWEQLDPKNYWKLFNDYGTGNGWPTNWLPFVDHRYMVEESEARANRDKYTPAEVVTKRRQNQRQAIIDQAAKKIREETTERDGKLWLFDHGLDIENVIYYSHRDIFTFGWREPVSDEEANKILDIISEFPFEYEIKSKSKVYSAREAA